MFCNFEYLEPGSLAEACSILSRYGEKARIIAGGTDVVVQMRHGKLKPEYLVSLNKIEELKGIREYDDYIVVGARVTHREIEKSPLLNKYFPVLVDGASQVGSVQIRNVATIGGNACNAAPSADTLPPLLALDAEVRIAGTGGERSMKLKDFFTGPGQTVLQQGEILKEFIIPRSRGLCNGAYIKHSRRRAMDLALLGVAVYMQCSEDGRICVEGRIALGTAGPLPMRAYQAEKVLAGAPLSEEVFSEAGRVAAWEARPRSSFRASEPYRREMIAVLVRRAAQKALARMSKGSGVSVR